MCLKKSLFGTLWIYIDILISPYVFQKLISLEKCLFKCVFTALDIFERMKVEYQNKQCNRINSTLYL